MGFEQRLRTAVRAGWWTLLIAAGVITVQWLAYLVVSAQQPSWFLWLWGYDVTWAQVESTWLAAMVALKLCFLVLALIVAWATLWARSLRKSASATAAPGA